MTPLIGGDTALSAGIRRAGRQVYQKVIQIAPELRSELFDGIADQRTAPDHGLILALQQKVYGHDRNAGLRPGREKGLGTGVGARSVCKKHFGNAWTRNVGIQDPYLASHALQTACEEAGNQRLADAAFAAQDSDYVLHIVERFRNAPGSPRAG